MREITDVFMAGLDGASSYSMSNETNNAKRQYSLKEFGLENFDKETLNNIKLKGGIVISTRQELFDHVKNAIDSVEKKNMYIGVIDRSVLDKNEKDLSAKLFRDKQYSFVMSYDDVRHVFGEHFKTIDDTVDAIERLYTMLSSYETVELKTGKKTSVSWFLKKVS